MRFLFPNEFELQMMNLFYRYNDLKIVIKKLEYVTKTYITSNTQVREYYLKVYLIFSEGENST